MVIHEIDGKVYAPPGQTTAGTPLSATMDANHVLSNLSEIERQLDADHGYLSKVCEELGATVSPSGDWKPFIEDGAYGFLDRRSGGVVQLGQLP
jgi:hypothetical protein